MKHLILIIILLLPQLAFADNYYSDANSWANKNLTGASNNIVHVVAGTAISYGALHYTDNNHIAASIPVVIGFIKESTDRNFCGYDLASWTVGGIVGAYVSP